MEKFGLWIGFIGMTIGAVIFGIRAVSMRLNKGVGFAINSFFITLWAATIYLSMALGQTVIPKTLIPNLYDHPIYWGHYVDWMITTPLLLLDIGILAGVGPKLLAGIVGADIYMIITGAAATFTPSSLQWIWYILSTGAFTAILLQLLTVFSASARRRNSKIANLFTTLRNLLIVLWITYPIIWLIGVEGLKLIGSGLEVLLYVIVDFIAKVGFGLVLLKDTQVLEMATKKSASQ